MLRAADVEINGHPVFLFVRGDERTGILWVDVPEIIPTAPSPLRHRVRLAFAGTAALRTVAVHPIGRLCQRRFGITGRRVILHLRQAERQFTLRYRHHAALIAMHNRNRLAPVALPGEKPIAQLVIHGRLAEFLLFEPRGNFLLRFRRRQTSEHARVHRSAIAGKALGIDAGRRLNDGANFQTELLRELKVARVMRRHGHDGAGAVAHHHVIGDPDWNLLVVDRVDGVAAGKDAGLFLLKLRPLEFALLRGRIPVGIDGRAFEFINERMLGRQHHIRRAEERVGTRRENAERLTGFGLEINFRTFAPANPVALLFLDRLRPVHLVEVC